MKTLIMENNVICSRPISIQRKRRPGVIVGNKTKCSRNVMTLEKTLYERCLVAYHVGEFVKLTWQVAKMCDTKSVTLNIINVFSHILHQN